MQLTLSEPTPILSLPQIDVFAEYLSAEALQEINSQMQELMQQGERITAVLDNATQVQYLLKQGPLTQATFEFLNMGGELNKLVGHELAWSADTQTELQASCLVSVEGFVSKAWEKFKAFCIRMWHFLTDWIVKLKQRVFSSKAKVQTIKHTITIAKGDIETSTPSHVYQDLKKSLIAFGRLESKDLRPSNLSEDITRVLTHHIYTSSMNNGNVPTNFRERIDMFHDNSVNILMDIQRFKNKQDDAPRSMSITEFKEFSSELDDSVKIEEDLVAAINALPGIFNKIIKEHDNTGISSSLLAAIQSFLVGLLGACRAQLSLTHLYINTCDSLAKRFEHSSKV